MKRLSMRFLFSLFSVCLLILSSVAYGDIDVSFSGPGGTAQQVLPNSGGQFDVNVPLRKNSINPITITATDQNGIKVSKNINVTQLSFDSLVVASIKAEPLPPARVQELVSAGVIKLDDPDNFNVSVFTIVLTIGTQPVPIQVPISIPKVEEPTGSEEVRPQSDSGGSSGRPPDYPLNVVVFEVRPPIPGPDPGPSIPGVLVIEGRIKTLKEFFSAKFLLMNTSGIFTLSDVIAKLEFPDEGLSATLPADGLANLGEILPGSGDVPGQALKEFIFRGDEKGVRKIRVSFGGKVTGGGIPETEEIPFNGAAETTVEVKGPPTFNVRLTHPDSVVANVPYEFGVEITNTGDSPALYTSLDLDVGADGELIECKIENDLPVCAEIPGAATRNFGHIYPGQTVKESFLINPKATGPITSCMGISDQNIDLQVTVGNIGCITGKVSPPSGVPQGVPTVTVLPFSNALGISPNSPVVLLFTEQMNRSTITTGAGGTVNVYEKGGKLVPGRLRFDILNGRDIAIWQVNDGILNKFLPNLEYTIEVSKDIRDLQGVQLFSDWLSKFTTTGEGFNDFTPPTITLALDQPLSPNNILPGQLIKISAFASDQGTAVQKVELRMDDLTIPEVEYKLLDQRNVLTGDKPPFVFLIDSKTLIPGHTYQLRGTAYDFAGNSQDSMLSFSLATTAPVPTITIPAIPDILKGVPLAVTPDSVTGGAYEVSYFVDGVLVKTVQLSPYSVTIPTLNLTVGTHTLSATAKDGLNQVGQTQLNFEVLPNSNAPQITFIDPQENQNILTGSVLPIKVMIDEPVGIQSIQWFFDNPNGSPFASNVTQLAINTVGIPLGTYKIYIKATNNLGLVNDVNAAGSFRTINIIDPPPVPPPAAPTLTLSALSQGRVTASGVTEPGRRVDISNVTQGFSFTINSNSSTGAYSGVIEGAALDQISVVAFDPSGNNPSPPATQQIGLPPQLQSISLNQSSVVFPNLNDALNLVVTGVFSSGPNQNVTNLTSFTTSNSAVAGVNSAGKIVANGNGTATITASLDGKTASINVSVTAVSLQSISVIPTSLDFSAITQTSQLTVTGNFSNLTTQVLNSNLLFVTGNPNIATVSSQGLVTATGPGSTTVTVSRQGVSPVAVPVTVQLNDNLAPTVSIQSPTAGSNFERGQSVTVSINAADAGSGVRKVSYVTAGAMTTSEERIIPATSSTTQSFTFTIPNTATIGGSVVITATAFDLAGNSQNSASISINVVDTTAPQAAITAPAPNSRYNFNDEIALSVQATDAVGVSLIRYETSGSFVLTGSQNFSGSNQSESHTFTFTVPFGVTNPDLRVKVFARDLSGNESQVNMIDLIVTSADITPPQSMATATSSPGAGVVSNISFEVTEGLSDLSHVELYFRKNGIGTFNRYTNAVGGNPEGRFLVTSGSGGIIPFDSTRMGGDGSYEFYTVAVDIAGNREPAPVNGVLIVPDQSQAFASGELVEIITTNRTLLSSDQSLENKNIRVTSGAVLTVVGSHAFKNVELLSGAVLTHAETDGTTEGSLDINLWSLLIDSTSSINLDGRGYLGGSKPGNSSCSGMTVDFASGATQDSAASYGGLGSQFGGGVPNPIYGLINFPDHLGSGGSCRGPAGGDGGGRARITAINIAADGAISANGEGGGGNFAGSGSGGGLRFTVATFSGAGEVRANGGARDVGAGGGRIAVFYTDMSTKNNSLFKALGGDAGYKGGVGTVFLKAFGATNGELVVDGQPGVTTFTEIPVPPGFVFDSITLRAGARVIASQPIEVTEELSITGNSILTHTTALESGLKITAKKVYVEAGSLIDVTGRGYLGGLQVGNPNTRGLTLGNALGATQDNSGSYGGIGSSFGGAPNSVYGSPFEPVYLGSGGPSRGPKGGNGGGRILIEATDSIEVDGVVSANGGEGEGNYAGSGSGGSVYLKTKILKGTGQISANGGARDVGGGGGRVRVDYQFLDPNDNFNDLQDVTAFGGFTAAGYHGSCGTILLKKPTDSLGELVIDSNHSPSQRVTQLTQLGFGKIQDVTTNTFTVDLAVPISPNTLVGLIVNPNIDQQQTYKILANTDSVITVDINGKPPLNSLTSINNIYSLVYTFDKVTVRDGAILEIADKLKVNNLLKVMTASVITHRPTTLDFYGELDIAAGNIDIDLGSSLNVVGKGYLGGLRGVNTSTRGRTLGNDLGATQDNSASHAGVGGSFGGLPNPVYGSIAEPVDLGAGGPSRGAPGGNGGGFIRLNVSGNLNVNGSISADGGNSEGNYAGSGAGGSVNIRASSITGSGKISANGGSRDVGAGGGRISARYDTLGFSENNFEVKGGVGGYVGGAGSIYLKSSSQTKGDLILNGFDQASNVDSTVLSSAGDFDRIVLRNGVNVVVTQPLNLSGDLVLENNSLITQPKNSEAGLQINVKSLTIDSTSRIDLTGRGYRGGLRDGNASSRGRTLGDQLGATQDSAASYGGIGGAFASGSPGFVYGSPFEPLYLGAGGSSRGAPGGNGGGLLNLTVSDVLNVNGAIRANGAPSDGNFAGSGAGGSILINVGTLRGSGVIAANGGARDVGGGGGRVRINYANLGGSGDDLAGLRNVSAFGGSTTYPGTPGSVLLKSTSQSRGSLIYDAGQSSGTHSRETKLTEIGFGLSSNLTPDTLTVQAGVTYLPGSLVGLRLNPNLLQNTDFLIISNTENTITVDVSSGTNLLSVAGIGDEYAASYEFDDLILRGGVRLTLADPLKVYGSTLITENSVLSHKDVSMTEFPRLELSGSNLTIESLSSIDVSARGYLGGLSSGNPDCRGRTIGNALGASSAGGGGAGGSYGGLGGLFSGGIPNPVYGSALSPVDYGSGGACRGSAGGDGGGVVFLDFGSITINGTISANGGASDGNFAGSGSGGSIRINTSSISGSGFIVANGGVRDIGGGGGRVSITAPTNLITPAQIQVLGGVTAYPGQNGSVSIQ